MAPRKPWGSLLLVAAAAAAACSPSDPAPPRPHTSVSGPEPAVPADPTHSTVPPGAQGSPSRRPPPRRGIAGIAGFQSRSRVVYASRPDEPHQLSAVYLFPGRMRIRLSL